MVRIPSIAATVAVVFLLLGGAQARCDFIPWRLETEVQQRTIGKPGVVGIDLIPSGTSPLQSGPARVPLVDVELVDDNKGNVRGGRVSAVIDYVISLFITDQNSHITSTALTFPGHMSGVRVGSQAFVVNHFRGPTKNSVTLGGNFYTVSLDPFTISRSHRSFHDKVGGDVFDIGTMTSF